ncbi:hypothetical protein EN851_07935 [Mesorhizobium sp. M8A.F.Ca.ET.208.01.1.1]|uniref:hypothetical protein n=1 Tax=unclassified Mesorhizobium TaxID=325217 RepID=UPI00109410DA|nr:MULTISPECIES: hypothetical protein [unclassified Mesorhizobium]TGQ95438.1 hypothetical protein EN851_07935 [Mesorhizobium sp. M8A.F.Ca.ET.208.01.1.1]TGT55929.1 hypothetical protein EN810_07935 [Mesorhizobium sp. M8A.F.Ca.ET.167.01.1.1]
MASLAQDTRDRVIRVEAKLEAVLTELQKGADGRGRLYEKAEEISDDLATVSADVGNVKRDTEDLKRRMSAVEPSVEDYLKKQQQVIGAGKLGKLLWSAGGVILAAAAWLVGRYYGNGK